MRFLSILALAILSIGAMTALAGCGGGGDDDAPPGEGPGRTQSGEDVGAEGMD
ncbi:MAG: hypothetical protein IH851_06070 [Armatimonadetes bacterium]|nr:hypothetical protein [Armatimonadota bacterium]